MTDYEIEDHEISFTEIENDLKSVLENIMKDHEEEEKEKETTTASLSFNFASEDTHHNQIFNLSENEKKHKTQLNLMITSSKINLEGSFELNESQIYVSGEKKKYNSTTEHHMNTNDILNEGGKIVKVLPTKTKSFSSFHNMANFNNMELNSINFISESFYQNFKGKFCFLIMNFNGSKILQTALPNTEPQIISKIFEEIYEKIHELIVHQYGNYFCKKLFPFLNFEERLKFLHVIRKHIVEIASNQIGNFPLQLIIESLSTFEEKQILADALQFGNNIHILIQDFNSVHVVEKAVMCIPEDQIRFLYDFVINNFIILSTNQSGLCVVKKVIANLNNFMTYKKIVNLMMENFQLLVQNIYGSHTIRVAIEYWNNKQIQPILKLFINKFAKLSVLKYSSNVVEKCLERGGEQLVDVFLNEIINSNKMVTLVKNNYGNYVLQKVLSLASISSRIYLINNILATLSNLEDKNLIVKWKHICDSHLEAIYRCDSMAQCNFYNPCIY